MEALLSLSRSATVVCWNIAIGCTFVFGAIFLWGWLLEEFATSEKWKKRRKLLITVAVIGVFGEQLSTLAEFALSKHLQSISDKEVADLNAETAEQDRKTAGLIAKVADSFRPREIPYWPNTGPVLESTPPPGPVLIQHVSDDEAASTSEQLAGLLDIVRWHPRFVTAADTCMFHDEHGDGIQIYVHADTPAATSASLLEKYLAVSTKAGKSTVLLLFDNDRNFEDLKFDLPKDEIFVFVGRKLPPDVEALLPQELKQFAPGPGPKQSPTAMYRWLPETVSGQDNPQCRSTLKK